MLTLLLLPTLLPDSCCVYSVLPSAMKYVCGPHSRVCVCVRVDFFHMNPWMALNACSLHACVCVCAFQLSQSQAACLFMASEFNLNLSIKFKPTRKKTNEELRKKKHGFMQL